MKSHGKWSGWVARFYYFTGSVYYAYHWFFVLGGVSLLASGTFAYLRAPVLVAVFLVIAFAATLCGFSFLRKLARQKLHSHNPGLKIHTISIDYRILSNTSCRYCRTIEATVSFPTECYECKFNWTGQGEAVGVPVKGTNRVEVFDHNGSADQVCRVHFGETLNKGCKHTFVYSLNLDKATKVVRPFLGHYVDSGAEKLTLRAHLNADQKITKYKRQVLIHSEANTPLWEQQVELDNPDAKELEWVIDKPQAQYFYRLAW